VDPETHTVNPSAPVVGTEAWENTTDEQRALSGTEPSATRLGQVIGNRGAKQTEPSRRPVATATSMSVPYDRGDRTFRCADVGNVDCRWETSGMSEEEIIEAVRQHAQSAHGWNDWTDALRDRVRDAIRERRAA
jgi:predicted small metal-binding protein